MALGGAALPVTDDKEDTLEAEPLPACCSCCEYKLPDVMIDMSYWLQRVSADILERE
jgi:hypothetical protein